MKTRIKINEAPISYDGPERMSPDIQKSIEDKDTPFSDNPALDIDINDDGDVSTFEELIASKRFKDVVDKVKRYTGLTNIPQGMNGLQQLMMMMAQAVQTVKSIENENKEYLENLSVDLVKKEMSLPENAFQFDVELTSGMGQVDTSKLPKKSQEPSEEDILEKFGVSEDEAEDDIDNFMKAFEKFDLEKAKRRGVVVRIGVPITEANIKVAKYVTTTTSIFADEIKKYNKNVFVLPNAINPKEPQFNEPTLESERLRVGWLGGSSHLADIQLLDSSISKLSQYKNDLQFVLCGFDVRGTVTEINSQTGEHTKRNIKPEETVWAKYEEIFTNKYNYVSDEFQKELRKFVQSEHSEFSNESYRRVWTLPVTSYAKNYAKMDVSLAPIKNHVFNRMKSQLKVIEAGFYKKALIASNLGPYTIDLKHCLKNGEFVDGNALLVDETRNHGDWAKFIQKLVKNRNLVSDMGERLYETVKDTYDLNVVTKTRSDFYKSLVK
jgi:glycosyltransferase involved in cell wall biosynthesis